MALDRQSIEKQDFPVKSRGYDPEAVDAHLSALADEVVGLKSSARRRGESLAASASDQVRAIIEAAESSSTQLQNEAEAEAREILEEAKRDSRSTREQATEEVREHVNRVSEAAAAMLGRLEGMESELAGLIDSVRSGATQLDSDLRGIEVDLTRMGEHASPAGRAGLGSDEALETEVTVGALEGDIKPGGESESWESSVAVGEADAVPAAPDDESESWDAGPASSGWDPPAESGATEESWESDLPVEGQGLAVSDAERGISAEPGEPLPDLAGEPVSASYGEPSSEGLGESDSEAPDDLLASPQAEPAEETDDSEGARLIALNMALNGSPRDETARYLSENFELADRDGLLDEVYASVEG